jgi:multiple sugar transport system ATP-binding protein
MAEVIYDHVTKEFGAVAAVNDLTLQVADREFLVLVGPSGCGKSTALRLLAGLEEITRGNIYIGDRLVNSISAKDRDIAMVFQSYALYPHMSVYDNLAFGLTLRKVPRTEVRRRVGEVARILDIEALLERKPRQLSGGQRQRVALGRAIVREPAVFLFDEPLSNLDAKLRAQTRAELNKLHQRLGTTFIYVTHDQIEAMTMATRIAVLRDGVLQQVGEPQELYERPCNVFVAGFIGSPEMNFFRVKVRGSPEEMFLDEPTFRLPVPEEKTKSLVPYLGKEIIIGIRPENLHDLAYSLPGPTVARIKATVEVTELMGNEIFLHLLTGDTPFLARVDLRTKVRAGQEVEVSLDMARMHAFDPQTEQALLD